MILLYENLVGKMVVIIGGSGVFCLVMVWEFVCYGMKVVILNWMVEKG